MGIKRVQKKIERTPEEVARLKAVREEFKDKPTLDQLLASGNYTEPMPLGQYLQIRQLLAGLRKAREAAGLSLTEAAERAGMDKALASRLETGRQPNPTLDTVARYAAALGKRIVFAIVDAENGAAAEGAAQREPGTDTAAPGSPETSRR